MTTTTYKDDIDVLMIEEDSYTDVDQSLELGGIVIDLDTDRSLLGIEIIDASAKLPLTPDDLRSIQDVKTALDHTDSLLRLTLRLRTNGQWNTLTSQYPQAHA